MQYSMVNCSHHAEHYTPMTALFYNWKLEPFGTLYPIHQPPDPIPGNDQSVLYIYKLFFFFPL